MRIPTTASPLPPRSPSPPSGPRRRGVRRLRQGDLEPRLGRPPLHALGEIDCAARRLAERACGHLDRPSRRHGGDEPRARTSGRWCCGSSAGRRGRGGCWHENARARSPRRVGPPSRSASATRATPSSPSTSPSTWRAPGFSERRSTASRPASRTGAPVPGPWSTTRSAGSRAARRRGRVAAATGGAAARARPTRASPRASRRSRSWRPRCRGDPTTPAPPITSATCSTTGAATRRRSRCGSDRGRSTRPTRSCGATSASRDFNVRQRDAARARWPTSGPSARTPTTPGCSTSATSSGSVTGMQPRRAAARALEARPDLVQRRDDLSVELCALYNQAGHPGRALAIVATRRFQPWEGGEGGPLAQHVRSHLALGRRALAAGDATTARGHFESALAPPRHLGEARHLLANPSDVHYWLGVACESSEAHARPGATGGRRPRFAATSRR